MSKDNIIQFPGSKKEKGPKQDEAPAPRPPKTKRFAQVAVTGLALGAIAFATAAMNSSIFRTSAGRLDLASVSAHNGRAIASVQPATPVRDAGWEMKVAEKLASLQARHIDSIEVGRNPTLEDRLRHQVLDSNYTLLRDLDRNELDSIVFARTDAQPSYILDRSRFLNKYGHVVSGRYNYAELKSSELINGRRFESYTVFDSSSQPYAVARFEMDAYQRLLAFHFDPLNR